MAFKPLDDGVAVSPQITLNDVAEAARQGYRSIISNRPDGEEPGQLSADEIRAEATRHGLAFAHIPVVAGKAAAADAAAMARAMDTLPAPVLAFCRSGMRSTNLWALAKAETRAANSPLGTATAAGDGVADSAPELRATAPDSKFDVVIVGGGSAGIATAASILKRNAKVTIAIVDPAQDHYYQPGWTLVGAAYSNRNRRGAPKLTSCPME